LSLQKLRLCLSKHGDALSKQEKDAIVSAYNNAIEAGSKDENAAVIAVESALLELYGLRRSVLDVAKKAGAKPGPEGIGSPGNWNIPALAEFFHKAIRSNNMPKRKIDVQVMLAKELGIKRSEMLRDPNWAHKPVEEAFEYAIVKEARYLINRGTDMVSIYPQLLRLYNEMPNLATRSSTSVQNQAYSTPVHLAWLMQEYTGVDAGNKTVYEPTAGTGMLLTQASPEVAWANELDDLRHEILVDQNFMTSQLDGAEAIGNRTPRGPRPKNFDIVLANPPFGSIPKETIGGYKISKLEHQIVINALKAMKDDGRAAFIIGGTHVNNSGQANINQQVFLNYLYHNYNTGPVIEIPGEQYSKQGAKFPVRLILINGRKSTPAGNAPMPNEDTMGPYKSGKGLPFYVKVDTIDQVASILKEVSDGTATLDTQKAPGMEPSPEGSRGYGERDTERRPLSAAGTGKGGRAGTQGAGPGTDRNISEPTPALSERPGQPGDRGARPDGVERGLLQPVSQPGAESQAADEVQSERGPGDTQIGQRGQGAGERGNVQAGAARSDTRGVSGTRGTTIDDAISDLLALSDQEAQKAKKREAAEKVEAGLKKVKAGIDKFNKLAGKSGEIGPDRTNPENDPQWGEFKAALMEVWEGLKEIHEGIKEAAQAFIKDIYQQLNSAYKNYVDHFIKTEIRKDLEAEMAPPPTAPASTKAEETDFQAVYQPKSKGPIIDTTLVPRKMKEAIEQSLDRFEDQHGDIDEYVRKKLAYNSLDQMYQALAADQIDAVALAISNIEAGAGMIVGDQTGVGKGRVAAAIWKYSRLNEQQPVFFTAKPQLFSDFYRDINDIGYSFNPVLMTSKPTEGTIKDRSGNIIQKPLGAGPRKALYDDMATNGAEGLGEFDGVLTTYSQINQPRIQQQALAPLFPGNTIILDEAHKAAGALSETGNYIRQMLGDAGGVVYLSATFSKRPETMSLYYKTDMNRANLSMEELIAAVEGGGTPLQEILASDLAKVGQMIRREKSFRGIEVRTEINAKDRARDEKRSDAMTAIMRKILFLDRNIADALSRELRRSRRAGREGNAFGINIPGSIRIQGGRLNSTVSRSNFAATMHNAVRQLLFGMKVDQVVEQAEQALSERSKIVKDGNTFSIVNSDGRVVMSGMDEDTARMQVAEQGRKVFVSLDLTMGSFVGNMVESGEIGEGDAFNITYANVLKRNLERALTVTVTDPLGNEEPQKIEPENLPPNLRAVYDEAMDMIEQDTAQISGSPIDSIKIALAKKGYKVDEITGRDWIADVDDPKNIRMRKRTAQEKGRKKEILQDFNDGKIDVLIVNRSAAEGVSAHASPSTGKDLRPRIFLGTQAQLNVDDEVQLMGRLNRKGQVMLPSYLSLFLDIPAELRPAAVLMRKMKSLSATTSANSDSPLAQRTLPDMDNRYGDRVVRLWLAENSAIRDELNVGAEAGFMKVSGKIAMMPVETQRNFFEEIELEYRLLIEDMKEQGLYDLEVQDIEYKAREVEKQIINQGRDENNPFGASTYREKLSVISPIKPFKKARIKAMLDERLGDKPSSTILSSFISDLRQETQAFIRERTETAVAAGRAFSSSNIVGGLDYIQRTINRLTIGGTYRIAMESQPSMTGVFLGVKRAKGRGNPAAPSRTRLEFAVNNQLRKVNIAISKIENGTAGFSVVDRSGIIDNWDEILGIGTRQDIYMITGNLLQGYANVPPGSRIVRFTMDDGTLREGIHLPLGYNPGEDADRVQVTPEQAQEVLRMSYPLTGSTVTITAGKDILVPRSRQSGGRFFLDPKLLELVDRNDFETRGDHMRAHIKTGSEKAAIDRIYELGEAFSVDRSIFSQLPGATNTRAARSNIIDNLTNDTGSSQLATDIYNYGLSVYRQGAKSFTAFKAKMYNKFKKAWQKIKAYMRALYNAAKNAVTNKRGMLGNYYSQAADFIADKLPNAGPPAKMAETIRAWMEKHVVATEEIEWSGLLEWLDGQKTRIVYNRADVSKWRIETVEDTMMPYTGQRDIVIYDDKGKWVSSRSGFRGTDEEALQNAAKDRDTVKIERVDMPNKITKQQILDYLKANNVQIVEVEKGKPSPITQEEIDRYDELVGRLSELTLEERVEYDELHYALARDPLGGDTKYAQYQEPGGKRYRELLLTMPPGTSLRVVPHPDRKNQWALQYPSGEYVTNPDEPGQMNPGQIRAWDRKDYAEKHGLRAHDTEVYRGGHYGDIPNVLVHVRFNERTSKDGKRVLFLEEIQSDWHQKGRKEGYKSDTKPPKVRRVGRVVKYSQAEFSEKFPRWPLKHLRDVSDLSIDNLLNMPQEDKDRIINAYRSTGKLSKNNPVWVVVTPNNNPYSATMWSESTAQNIADQWVIVDPITNERRSHYGKTMIEVSDRRFETKAAAEQRAQDLWELETSGLTPDAPFKKSSQWSMLAFKRMVRYAAENGFDMVSWTPGEVQVERYKDALRQAVDEIHWYKGQEGIHLIGKKNNEIVVDTNYKENQISDAIGKAMGDSIIENPDQEGVIEGDDITISDLGMAGFYDKILPSSVNKFFNKAAWGKAKVTTVEFAGRGGWKAVEPNTGEVRYPGTFGAMKKLMKADWQITEEPDQIRGPMEIEKIVAQPEDAPIVFGTQSGIFFDEDQEYPDDQYAVVQDGFILEQFEYESEARAYIKKHDVYAGPAWALPITPKIKNKAITEGMPLYHISSIKRVLANDIGNSALAR
jgi:hypothetical protein